MIFLRPLRLAVPVVVLRRARWCSRTTHGSEAPACAWPSFSSPETGHLSSSPSSIACTRISRNGTCPTARGSGPGSFSRSIPAALPVCIITLCSNFALPCVMYGSGFNVLGLWMNCVRIVRWILIGFGLWYVDDCFPRPLLLRFCAGMYALMYDVWIRVKGLRVSGFLVELGVCFWCECWSGLVFGPGMMVSRFYFDDPWLVEGSDGGHCGWSCCVCNGRDGVGVVCVLLASSAFRCCSSSD